MIEYDNDAANRQSREKIARDKNDTQKEINEKRTDVQERLADQKITALKQAREMELNKNASNLAAAEVNAQNSVELEQLQQEFYARKKQIDYEFDVKYRDLDFQQFRLETTENIRRQQAIIKSERQSSIEQLKTEMLAEQSKLQLAGQIERNRIRAELTATLYEIKARLSAELALKKSDQEHELRVLKAKHEYEMEMEILRDHLRRRAETMNIHDVAAILEDLKL